ncbi:MAG: hypothetical protein SO016_11820 [Lachnospiraceae bacterium]|nr:hypothetical protein [Robinsoniella sp.]MDY3767354.1 hypothetical protein [Lachnospiraceae bacterium]
MIWEKSRAQLQKKSGRTYDDEKRRIRSYLGECVKESYENREKQISISMSRTEKYNFDNK